MPERIGWLIAHPSGSGFIAGLQSGIALVKLEPQIELEWLNRFHVNAPQMRLNDGKRDHQGNIWCGSMNNDDQSGADGLLYRVSPDGRATVVDKDYHVPNGPAIDPSGMLMLHSDSARRSIYAFDLDAASGTISGKRLWKTLSVDEGYPDGMTFDAEGCLWLAHWAGSCVSRYDVDGKLMRRVQLPVSQVTNVCFGGNLLDRLFVTSARIGLSDDVLAKEPLAGGVFEIMDVGVCGFAS